MKDDVTIVIGTREDRKFILLVTKDRSMVKSVSEAFEKENPNCYASSLIAPLDEAGDFAI